MKKVLKGNLEVGWMKFKDNLSYLFSIRTSLFLALAWVLFMMFFTYTALVVELLKIDGNFVGLFYGEQSRYIALFVNIGLVVMLLFDNHVSLGKKLHGAFYYVPIIGIILSILLMTHCRLVVAEAHKIFVKPISREELSFVIYGFLMLVIYLLKVKSLITERVNVRKGVK